MTTAPALTITDEGCLLLDGEPVTALDVDGVQVTLDNIDRLEA